jgi:hypothetical protein
MISSSDIAKCLVPSRRGAFKFSTTLPAALRYTRTLANAWLVM